jgi:hypothetical protein
MDIENRQRTDISPYEWAMSYARWLSRRYFGSRDEIARPLLRSSQKMSESRSQPPRETAQTQEIAP